MKTCKNCHEEKKLSQFYKNKHMLDGHVNICITCKVGEASKSKHNLSKISGLLQRWATNANQRCDHLWGGGATTLICVKCGDQRDRRDLPEQGQSDAT